MFGFLCVILVVSTVLPLGTLQAEPQSPIDDEPFRKARTILSDNAYQKELIERDRLWESDEAEQSIAPRKDESRKDTSSRRREVETTGSPRAMPDVGVIVWIIFFLMLGVVAILVGLALIQHVHRRTRGSAEVEAAPDPTPRESGAARSLEEVERLASAGRHAEAVHELFLLALERLSAAKKLQVAPWLTGRELIRRLPRSKQERTHFKRLVAAVELSLFGDRPIGSSAYNLCLEAYRELAP